MPWEFHKKTGSSDKTNRAMDTPPPGVTHFQWRKVTHNPYGILMLRIALGDQFAIEEAVKHVLADTAMSYNTKKKILKFMK